MVAFYKNFNDQCISVKSLIFCVGLSLTIWRSSECLQKYLHANLSTKVTMVKTNEVILPSLVLCPATKYNHSALNEIGIGHYEDYRGGNFFGNSSLDGITIFEMVTFKLSDLIHSIEIQYHNGKGVQLLKEDFDSLDPKPRTVSNIKYGRCYELLVFDNKQTLYYTEIHLLRDLEIYIDIPFQFYTNTRSRIFANANEKLLYIKVNYEILKINHGHNCRKYSDAYSGSYDQCKVSDMERKIQEKFNCSIPSMKSQPENLCKGPVTKNASQVFYEYFKSESTKCPQTCTKMTPIIGMPKHKAARGRGGKARLYFDNIVKVTEDFVSYDILSMVAEIGGYSGLLIGFSLLDCALLFKKLLHYIYLISKNI